MPTDDTIIGGGPDKGNNGAYIGREKAASSREDHTTLAQSTLSGGLKEVPVTFEDKDGDWKTIDSGNLFEVLYLDYRHYYKITDEIVKSNFEIISDFWKKKNRQFLGAQKEQIIKKYGQATVEQANKKLERAFDQLRTGEGRELYYQELEKRRYNNGIKAITPLIDSIIGSGRLGEMHEKLLMNAGAENDLSREEIIDYLFPVLTKNVFSPKAKTLSDNPFKNKWMTPEVSAEQRVIKVNGQEVHNLEEYGQVLSDDFEFASKHLQDAGIAASNVTLLLNGDEAEFYRDLINDERDIKKRVLKVIYHFNSGLPYKFDFGNGLSQAFYTIEEILNESFKHYSIYKLAEDHFKEGYLSIWLELTDEGSFSKLPNTLRPIDFIGFYCKINQQSPLYLEQKLVTSPADLVEKLNSSATHWHDTIDYISGNDGHPPSGYLPAWFTGIGKDDINKAYNRYLNNKIFGNKLYSYPDERSLAAIQGLIQIIKPDTKAPELETSTPSVDLEELEATSQAQTAEVEISLKNKGYTKAKIYLDRKIDGISIDISEYAFWSQKDRRKVTVNLSVDAFKLNKGEHYNFNIIVETLTQKLTIPVSVSVVFPQNAYKRMLIKYALIFAGFMVLLALLAGGNEEYGVYILALFVAWLIWWIKNIKKIEKI